MNLTIEEFWDLTPMEFHQLVMANKYRDQQEMRVRAWEISWLIRPHLKKAIRGDQIYNPGGNSGRRKASPEYIERGKELIRLANERIRKEKENAAA